MSNTNRASYLVLLILSLISCNGQVCESECEGLQRHFYPKGRALGQPLTSRQTDIRIVRVESDAEGYDFFRKICMGGEISETEWQGDVWEYCKLPEPYGGYLLFTRRPRPGWRQAGSIYIRSPLLNRWGFSELRFVETIKSGKNREGSLIS